MSSKTNLELKHFCSDFSKIRKALIELGAAKTVVKKQKDYFFNVPAQALKCGGRLKLRIADDEKNFIYYERPKFQANTSTISRVLMYPFADKDLLPFLQNALGMQAVVSKKREVWKLDTTVFHLDTVKGVGNIFELELRKKGKITEKDRRVFHSYQEKLAPFLGKVIQGSNIDLVLKANS